MNYFFFFSFRLSLSFLSLIALFIEVDSRCKIIEGLRVCVYGLSQYPSTSNPRGETLERVQGIFFSSIHNHSPHSLRSAGVNFNPTFFIIPLQPLV